MRALVIIRVLVLLETLLLVSVALLPAESVPTTGVSAPRAGDLDHFLLYLIYGVLLSLAFPLKRALVGVGVGVLTELLQVLAPSRVFDPLDIVINVLGIVIGIVIVSIHLRKRTKKKV